MAVPLQLWHRVTPSPQGLGVSIFRNCSRCISCRIFLGVLLRKLWESSEVGKPSRGAVFISRLEGHLHLQQLSSRPSSARMLMIVSVSWSMVWRCSSISCCAFFMACDASSNASIISFSVTIPFQTIFDGFPIFRSPNVVLSAGVCQVSAPILLMYV